MFNETHVTCPLFDVLNFVYFWYNQAYLNLQNLYMRVYKKWKNMSVGVYKNNILKKYIEIYILNLSTKSLKIISN